MSNKKPKKNIYVTKVERVLRAGLLGITRNGVVSVASILVMTVTLFSLSGLLIGGAVLDSTLSQIKDKVDINVYFKSSATQDEMMALKEKVSNLAEVRSVEFISREDALRAFKEKHKDNSTIMAALDELGDNPLEASLNVRTKDPSQYEGVAKILEQEVAASMDNKSPVDKVNYNENKVAIEKLSRITRATEKIGLSITLFFACIAILVTYNTIRLAIYTSREEIAIMKLVGASNNFARGPFFVESLLYAIISTFVSLIAMYPATLWLDRATGKFFGSLDITSYYLSNIFQFLGITLFAGIAIAAISSALAIRKYLKI